MARTIRDEVIEELLQGYRRPDVHLIRNSLAFVSWKDRKVITPDLKAIYRAETAETAITELDRFEADWASAIPRSAPCAFYGLSLLAPSS